jgi:glycosyltransferase involved in cell wall biosynthesis
VVNGAAGRTRAQHIRVALNAHFRHHPGTGSGQYLTHLLRHFDGGPVEAIPLFQPALSNLQKVWWEQVAFPRAAQRSGAAVWHVPYFAPPLTHARPLVVTIHDLIPLIIPEYVTSPLVRLYNALVGVGARRADVILADSEASKRDIVRLLGIAASRVRVVYLAPDEAVYRDVPAAERAAVRAKYGLAEQYVLYFGGLDKRKNVPALLRALAALPEVEWQLAISGRLRADNPRLFPDLPALAAQLGIQDRVRFLGFAPDEDKPALIRGATCFAFPSLYEGFGMDPLEALACGTPVVCSNRSSLPELMGDAALLVDPDDTGALAADLRRLLTEPDLRADLATRGPAQAARFSWEVTAGQTYEAYAACAS